MRTDIVVPDGKPAFEWIAGHAVQKVSPKRDHAIVQRILATALGAWAEGRGEVRTEWRFRVTPPGEPTRPLVPDIAYVSYARLAGMTHDEKQEPRTAPDIVIEVRSPDDRQSHIDEKRRVYIAAGTTLDTIDSGFAIFFSRASVASSPAITVTSASFARATTAARSPASSSESSFTS